MNSIRRHLLLWQVAAVAVAAILVSLVTYFLAWDGFNRVRDHTLEQIAWSILRHRVDNNPAAADPVQRQGQLVSQIWSPQGTLVFSSHPDLNLPRQAAGLHNLDWRGEEWHIFTAIDDEGTVQVANTAANRARMFGEISPWLLLPLALLVTVFGALLSLGVGRALRPLEAMSGEIRRRGADHLSTLPSNSYPNEIAPLAEALNALLVRLERMLRTQRSFVADAAHELRTPLTAIKLQTQIARASRDEENLRTALSVLQGSVDRAAHLVDQLLQLARIDPELARQRPPGTVALDALAKSLVAEYSGLAENCSIDLGLGKCAAVQVKGDAESLRIMLGNLIDNALRYGKPNGRVDVELEMQDRHADLRVIDDGPGIPDDEKPQAFERFHRLAGADIPGSGLGLAIVAEIVAQHDGSIFLRDTPGGGLSIHVSLPLAGIPHAA